MEFSILLTALSTASWMRMDVYRDTTSKLQGYGNDLLVVRSPACRHSMSSKLFSRCAGTFFSMGSRALRFIHARLREHLNNDNFSVKKHILTCQRATNNESNDVKIIAKESDPSTYDCLKHFTYESTNQNSTPAGRNVLNSEIFCPRQN